MRGSPCALVAAFLLAACSDPPPASQTPDASAAECASRAECEALYPSDPGLVCSAENRCAGCASDGQCELRELCEPASRRCVFKPGWGEACSLNGDCAAGQLCVQGLCKAAADAVLCPTGACLTQGQRCNRVNGVCEEDLGCLADADCAAAGTTAGGSMAELCNLPTHACVRRCTPETQGDACDPGQVCVNDRCSQCATTADCPSGLACDLDRLLCRRDGSAACLSNRDCPVGQVCNPSTSFCTAPPPACSTNDDCPVDQRCDIAAGKCLPRTCQPDRWEPNPDATNAKPLTAGTFDGMTLCDREQDWYAFSLARGDRIDVFVDADPFLEPFLDTRLLDDLGRIVAQGPLALDRVVTRDGTYFLRLQSSDAYVAYGLRIGLSKGVPCDEDRFEPNDDPRAPSPVHAAGEIDALSICGLDVDWFLVDVPSGSGLGVILEHVPTEGDLDLYAFALNGVTELGRSATVDPIETLSIPAAAATAGQVLIKVDSADSRAHAPYLLRIGYSP